MGGGERRRGSIRCILFLGFLILDHGSTKEALKCKISYKD
jgi:hypothetical protein